MTWFLREEEWVVSTRSEFEDRLAVLLAGRAGEELLIGEPTTGARGDLEQASRLARRMVAELGMGELLGASASAMGTVDTDVERPLSEVAAARRG
jgi:cell division protease FtsH